MCKNLVLSALAARAEAEWRVSVTGEIERNTADFKSPTWSADTYPIDRMSVYDVMFYQTADQNI